MGPGTLAILQRYPSHRRKISIIGLVIIVVALFAASFAENVIHLVLTQGLLYGIGSALLYNPFLFYMDEWFIKRKGLAYSIFWAGTGFSGAVMPILMEWSLGTYGFRTTLRAWALFIVSNALDPPTSSFVVLPLFLSTSAHSKTGFVPVLSGLHFETSSYTSHQQRHKADQP